MQPSLSFLIYIIITWSVKTGLPHPQAQERPWCLCIICGRVGEGGVSFMYLLEIFLCRHIVFPVKIFHIPHFFVWQISGTPEAMYHNWTLLPHPLLSFEQRESGLDLRCCYLLPTPQWANCALYSSFQYLMYNLQCALIYVVAICCQHPSVHCAV